MKLIRTTIFMGFSSFSVFGQITAPIEVVNSGVAAVNDLGSEVVKGKFACLYERMNPQWRARLAEKIGGEAKLRQQCESAGAVLAKNAMTITRLTATGFPTVFEVSPGKKESVVEGKKVETLIYTQWLLLVPTITHMRIVGVDGTHTLESRSFQVAVSPKSELQWTFIDGKTTSVAELRNLFISLPVNVTLPKQEQKLLEQK